MSHELPIPPPGFDDLSVDEKIDYVQSLWDRIAAKPEDVPVPEWHMHVLAERLEAHRDAPNHGKAWEGVREDIRRKLREQSSGD